MTSKLS